MIHIFVIHGIVEEKNPDYICQRNFFEKAELENYLKNRDTKFIGINDALQRGEGDVITIDDSTCAAFDAALLLRKHGNQVSCFVNPFYIENERDYFTSYLNYYLDITTQKSIIFKKEHFELTNYELKNDFRRKFRSHLRKFIHEEDRYAEIVQLADILKLRNPVLPEYLKTFRKADVWTLLDNGVQIENHGWIHNTLQSRKHAGIELEHFNMAEEWLFRNFNVVSRFYAPPFGDFINNKILNVKFLTLILLFSGRFSCGFIHNKVYNRMCCPGSQATRQ